VWMGNDDYSPTKRMTGGTLPAIIWHNIMTYAHQDVELRQMPGMPVPQHPPPVADAGFTGGEEHPILLTRKGTDALLRVERLLDDAAHGMAPQAPAAGTLGALDNGGFDNNGARRGAVTVATEQPPAATPRGN
jgi:penicillin-binding protein 1A